VFVDERLFDVSDDWVNPCIVVVSVVVVVDEIVVIVEEDKVNVGVIVEAETVPVVGAYSK
jgi:hypothetical protein